MSFIGTKRALFGRRDGRSLPPLSNSYTDGLVDGVYSRAGGAGYIGSDGTFHTVTADTPRVDATFGYLSEIGTTNYLPNNSGQGASAGNMPTGWPAVNTGNGNLGSGMTFEVVGKGTSDGIDYVRYRLHGTPAHASAVLFLFWCGSQVIPAAVGETWTSSAFLRIESGTLNNSRFIIGMHENNAAGTQIVGWVTDPILPTGDPLIEQRFSATRTLIGNPVGTLTAFVEPNIRMATVIGEAFDVTFDVGFPQPEKAQLATTPIRTTTAPVTRDADDSHLAVSLAVPWGRQYSGAGKVEISGITSAFTPGASPQVVWAFSDFSGQNRIRVYRDSTQTMHAEAIVGGVSAVDIPLYSVANNTSFNLVLTWGGTTFSASLNGETLVTKSGVRAAANMTMVYRGRDMAGNHWGGWITTSKLTPASTALPIPTGVDAGATISMDFANERFLGFTPHMMTTIRASLGAAYDANGNLITFPANVPVMPTYNPNDGNAALGLSVWPTTTNHFQNGYTPATQTFTAGPNTFGPDVPDIYTVYCYGSGSITMSGAASGVVEGSDAAKGFFGASYASIALNEGDQVTFTVAGSLSFMQLSKLPDISAPIRTGTVVPGAYNTDYIQLPISANPGLVNPLQGTFVIRFFLSQVNNSGSFLTFTDQSTEQRLAANFSHPPRNTGVTLVRNNVYVAGVDPAAVQVDTIGYYSFGFTWQINPDLSGPIRVALNGNADILYNAPVDFMPPGMDTLVIGSDRANGFPGSQPLNGYIQRVTYWPRYMSQADLAAFSAETGP